MDLLEVVDLLVGVLDELTLLKLCIAALAAIYELPLHCGLIKLGLDGVAATVCDW